MMRFSHPTLSLLIVLFAACEMLAGAWTLPAKRFWVKTALYYQETNHRFCTEQDALSPAFQQVGCTHAGDKAPFDPFIGGTSSGVAIITEINYGITGWLDLGVSIPFQSLRFTNLADPDRPAATNIGDIRFFSKWRFISDLLVGSFVFGVKSPTGEFTVDAEVVNLSEGQWDFDFIAEFGKSFWPLPLYMNLAFGYRIRTDNKNFEYSFGNEWLGRVEGGFHIMKTVMFKATIDYLHGEPPQIKFTGDELLKRRQLFTVAPSLILMPIRNVALEFSVRYALAGQDYPAAAQYMTAITYEFGW